VRKVVVSSDRPCRATKTLEGSLIQNEPSATFYLLIALGVL
jgi:hypothetical protein